MELPYWEVAIIFENGINSHDFDGILFHLSYYMEGWGDAHGRAQLIPLGMWFSSLPTPPDPQVEFQTNAVMWESLVAWISWSVFKSLVVSKCA